MNEIMHFKTRREAVAEIATMRGWDHIRPMKICLYSEDSNPKPVGHAWIIEIRQGTSDPTYLCADGYVR